MRIFTNPKSNSQLFILIRVNKFKYIVNGVLYLLFFASQLSYSQTTVNYDTVGNDSFEVPCDVTSITVEIWGAGGGGYGDNSNDNIVGRGGGGGGYSSAVIPVTGGQIINFTVGAGGASGSPIGGNGGNTSFLSLLANGGTGGNVSSGGIGGSASGGSTNQSGTNGNTVGGTQPTGYSGGNGGGSGGGLGGNGGGNGANGSPGNIPGGGGGASGDRSGGAESGGAGANGRVRITYTSTLSAYCSSNFTTVEPITNVTFAGINNTTSATVNGTPANEIFCDTANVIQGNTTNQIEVQGNTAGNFTNYIRAYFDWDQNGTFGNNANEIYDLGTITNSTGTDAITLLANISVPATAALGNTKMRITKNFASYVTGPCVTNNYGQSEDYLVNVSAPSVCNTPTAQPTMLSLTPTGNTILGTFSAANPVADNYLVVVSTSNTSPTPPVNGNTYTIGNNLSAGYTIVDNDSNTSFTATGLTPLTTYYFYIYSFNSICTGGPLYMTTNPLTGNVTTLNANYCEPTSDDPDGLYINNVAIVGSLSDPPANASTFSGTGYQDFTTLPSIAVQSQGQAINVLAYCTGTIHARGAWKAWIDWNKDGDFTDTGEEVYNIYGYAGSSVTFGFRIPGSTSPGNYRLRIKVNNGVDYIGPPLNGYYENFGFDFTPCDNFSSTPTTPKYWGETEDYIFTVIQKCNANITSVNINSGDGIVCGSGTATLTATGTGGTTEFRWYDSETGGSLLGTSTPSSPEWTTPSITVTTSYWVTAYNGSCESVERTEVVAEVKPIPTLTFNTSTTELCGTDVIAINAAGDTEIVSLLDVNFQNNSLNPFENVNNDTNPIATDNKTQFKVQASVYDLFTTNDTNVWAPAVSSGLVPDRFAIALSDASNPDYPSAPVENSLTLINAVDTQNFNNLNLELDFYYSRFFPAGVNPNDEYVAIELSTDNGATFPVELERFTQNTGIGSKFTSLSYDLTAYINIPQLKIRIRLYSLADTNGWLPDGVAVDNIKLYGEKDLNTAFDWNVTTDSYSNPAATIPYITGVSPAIPTIYVKPSIAQLENSETFTFTASATLNNGCSASQDITVNNKTKVWQGITNDWNNPNNWKPNSSPAVPSDIPNSTNCVIIPNKPFDAEINGSTDANAYNLTVLNGGVLSIFPGGNVTVQDIVNVNAGGTFDLQSANGAADGTSSSLSGSLIQVNDVTNIGNITYRRAAYVRTQDYVYWSTPVENYPLTGIGSTTHRYKWIPTVSTNTPTGYGEWQQTSENMISGKGYIVRGPTGNGNTATTATWNTTFFSGVPNNGTITLPVERGNYTTPGTVGNPNPNQADLTENDDNWNLVGNPYPSTLDADAFLTLNAQTNNRITGTLWLWQHGIKIRLGNSPFFGEYLFNYDELDYLEYNLSGSTGGFSGYIGSGQGFFVLMDDASASGSTIEYNNTMRGSSFDSNAQFFRNSDPSETQEREKHRIWLDFINTSTDKISTILFGYIEDATDDYDKLFDAPLISGSSKKIFMPNEDHNKNYVIQGRALPFDNSDIIPINVITEESQNYAIALNNFDGLFETENQAIYLEDLFLGIIHNLKDAPYLFTSNETGVIENRFVIRFTESSLGTDEFDFNNLTISAPNSDFIKVVSNNGLLSQVIVYDLLGRELVNELNINSEELIINNIPSTAGTYIVKARLQNGNEKIQKVVLK